MRLKDKVVLITASTRGIGLAIVKKCAEEGALVYMAARDMERAQEIASALHGVKCVYNDATKPETFTSMVEDVVRDAGRIDVLVNNFGTSNPGKDLDFANTDPQVFLDTVNLNLRSVFLASQAAAKHMAKNGGGSIINIGSYMGNLGPNEMLYVGTDGMSALGGPDYFYHKSGMHNLTRFLAGKYGPLNVRCNCLALGGLFANQHPAFVENYSNATYMGRLAKEDDVKGIMVYLASDASAYLTGTVIPLDGGYSAK
jgi:NAD(P)-dependent dehydrogenase (short-subunit alcohol dehydrogenase family)